MPSTRGRQVVVPLTNKSGGAVANGDVVILDSSTASSFTTTTSAAQTADWIGVAQETIADNASGRVLLMGYAGLVNLASSASLGDYLRTHTVAKQAQRFATPSSGDFGQVLGTGTTPAAIIWARADQGATAVGQVSTINFVIDGGGSTITTGIKGDLVVDFACTITAVTTLADQSGSIVVDIWKDSYANYPPVDADSITASAPPTISSATKAQDTTLTGWTTSITAGQTLRFNVDSVTTLTRAVVALKVARA